MKVTLKEASLSSINNGGLLSLVTFRNEGNDNQLGTAPFW